LPRALHFSNFIAAYSARIAAKASSRFG